MTPDRPDTVRAERPAHRVAVIGDVAGHLDELRTELRRLGADGGTGRLPGDQTIIQVSDLVHRGPASDAVVALVDVYLTRQPMHRVQLVGNTRPTTCAMRCSTGRSGSAPGRATPCAADGPADRCGWPPGVGDDAESFLITHVGVTADFWRSTLGAPISAEPAAITINSLIGVDDGALFGAGTMLHGRRRARSAGPVWAAAAEAKHESTVLAGGRIIGIDPGARSRPRRPWHP